LATTKVGLGGLASGLGQRLCSCAVAQVAWRRSAWLLKSQNGCQLVVCCTLAAGLPCHSPVLACLA